MKIKITETILKQSRTKLIKIKKLMEQGYDFSFASNSLKRKYIFQLTKQEKGQLKTVQIPFTYETILALPSMEGLFFGESFAKCQQLQQELNREMDTLVLKLIDNICQVIFAGKNNGNSKTTKCN